MDFSQPTSQIWLGAIVGVISSITAISMQLRIAARSEGEVGTTLPGCILLVAGFLGGIGLIMIVASMLLTGGIELAIGPGLGVLAGFFAGSFLMIGLRLLGLSKRSNQAVSEPGME